MSNTRIYRIWKHILGRCFNPNDKAYSYYGGRGIGCEWQNFGEFFADVGDPPDGKSLDRPDNNRSYGPNNWQWATPAMQAANRRPPKKRRIKLGDPKILAEIERYREALTRAGALEPRGRT
jgi:hypothetical protein